MIIGFLCFIIFLFITYELSKDDFIFLRKGISVENIFNTIFLGLPIALFCSRLVYVFLHPSLHYLNPLIFFVVPYFPGLSLIGGILGGWLFAKMYAAQRKMPAERVLDILSIAFLFSLSIGILLQGGLSLFSNRLLGIEEIGRGILGIVFAGYVVIEFFHSKWEEGIATYLVILFYCILAFLSTGFMLLSHQHILMGQFIVTVVFFAIALVLWIYKENPMGKLLKK